MTINIEKKKKKKKKKKKGIINFFYNIYKLKFQLV